MIGHFLLNQQTTATAVVIIIEPVDGAGAGRLLVRTLPIRLYLGCDAPICLPLTTGSIFMTLAVGAVFTPLLRETVRKGRGEAPWLLDQPIQLEALGLTQDTFYTVSQRDCVESTNRL